MSRGVGREAERRDTEEEEQGNDGTRRGRPHQDRKHDIQFQKTLGAVEVRRKW